MRIQSDALNRLVRSVFLRAGSEPSEASAIADHFPEQQANTIRAAIKSQPALESMAVPAFVDDWVR